MSLSILLSAFGLGLVLASSPGPVQTVLLAESARGGRRRGFAAMLGANAVVGMRFDSSEIGESLTEIVAYGTAVVVSQRT